MGTNARQSAIDAKAEIDTRAPFASVKAAVSLFGEVAFTSDRSSGGRKLKLPTTENAVAKQSQLQLAEKELNKYKEQLNNAETAKTQALAELESTKRTIEELTNKLNASEESKAMALEATQDAKSLTSKLDATSAKTADEDSKLEEELNNAREQHAVTMVELDATKQELRKIKKDFEESVKAKLTAIHQEAEAEQHHHTNTEKMTDLSKEVAVAQESFMRIRVATEEAQLEESDILSAKDAIKQSYKQMLEETLHKLSFLKKEFDPAFRMNLEAKLAETTAEIAVVQKELQHFQIAEATADLDAAKQMVQNLAVEEISLLRSLDVTKKELKALKKEHAELKEKEAETESVVTNLNLKLQKCKAELEAVMAAESKEDSASDDLTSSLQQLSSESQKALQEAEDMKRSAQVLWGEAEASKIAIGREEERLLAVMDDAEAAKAAEARALDLINDQSQGANTAQESISESETNITISEEEYESLTRRADECERMAEAKADAVIAQMEIVKAAEDEAVRKLEVVEKELKEMMAATEEVLRRAEMAEAAKNAVEGELRRWRDKEQMNTDGASMSAEESYPPRPVKSMEKSEENRRTMKPSTSKRVFMPNLGAFFHRKKSQSDGGSSPSLLPGDKPL